MRRFFNQSAILVLALMLLASGQLFAQEWTAAQKDVWKNVEAYWAAFGKGDLEGFLSYMDESYKGWTNSSALPGTRESAKMWLGQEMKSSQTLVNEVKPVAIEIHDDVAIVHYYYTELVKNAEGKQENRSGRWTDILKKKGDKWVMIADHGGQTSEDND